MPDRLLDSLDAGQRAVALATRGPVAVLAVAGAGKTRAIAHRIAYATATGGQPAETGLALSYTTKSAAELRSRLSQLAVTGVTTTTIHATALRMLNFFWAEAFGGSPFEVLQRREPELRRFAEQAAGDLDPLQLRNLVSQIELGKSRGLDPQTYLELAGPTDNPPASLIGEVWSRYADWCTSQRLMDFDDVIQLLLGALQSRPDLVTQVRQRYTWFTVDEYQDITPLQQALLDVWVGERAEVCVVGDPQQSIYEFAGAAPQLLIDFAKRHPNVTMVELDRTYRCAPEIANLANSISGSGALHMRSDLPTGQVTLVEYAKAADELAALAHAVRDLLDAGVDLREVAVLTRIGAQLDEIERALTAAGVPATSRPNDRFFEHPLVRRSLLILRAWSTDHAELASAVRAAVVEAGWSETTDDLGSWQAGSSLLSLALDLADLTVSEFLAEVERRAAALDVPRPPAVQLLTMHAAKGLEWQHVFLPAVNDRLLPYPGVAEQSERNLLYVACTRARSGLHISWAASDERGRSTARSPLLAATGRTARSAAPMKLGGQRPSDEPAAVGFQPNFCRLCGRGLATVQEHSVRRCHNCPSDADPGLLRAIADWRTRAASERGIADWLLLPNASVQALAELRPSTLAELAEVHGFNSVRIEQFGAELLKLIIDR